MTVIHPNDPTTKFLSLLYETRDDISALITEANTKSEVQRAIRGDDTIMMLGHGSEFALFSDRRSTSQFGRQLVNSDFVQFLRDKTCIGIWCHANKFAERYHLHGLFSGMIISEEQEAVECEIAATKEEIEEENIKFAIRLKDCIERYGLKETPQRMKELDDAKSELTTFNYNNLYYSE